MKNKNPQEEIAPGQVFLKPDLTLGTYEGDSSKDKVNPLPPSAPEIKTPATCKYNEDTLYTFIIEGNKKTYRVLGINDKGRLILYNVDTDNTITITEQYFQFWLKCKLIEKIKKSV